MKITLEIYNPAWPGQFSRIREELLDLIGFLTPRVEHIGSTSVTGLSAKPIIDILVGLNSVADLDRTVEPLTDKGYIHFGLYNEYMPYRRFFVRHQDGYSDPAIPAIIVDDNEVPRSTEEHDNRLAHVHILPVDSIHWTRHIAFREYLRSNHGVRAEYQRVKEELACREWKDGNEYNKAKDAFIKEQERRALAWYGV